MRKAAEFPHFLMVARMMLSYWEAVIASAAKQSRIMQRFLDCFVARAPRNDGWIASSLRSSQ
jgi:hypothetical protein